MEPASIIATLALRYGPKIAESLWATLGKSEDSASKIENATKMMELGLSTMDALKKSFGSDFYDNALSTVVAAVEGEPPSFDFEAGLEHYVRVTPENSTRKSSIESLREELNINLERVAIQMQDKKTSSNNYFIGLMREWERRHNETLGSTEDSSLTFESIARLLDGRRRTYKEVLLILQKTTLGFTGAALILYSVLLAIGSVGTVGVFAWIGTLFMGPPIAIIFGSGLAGALLLAFSRIEFKSIDARSTAVRIAYALLDRAKKSEETK